VQKTKQSEGASATLGRGGTLWFVRSGPVAASPRARDIEPAEIASATALPWRSRHALREGGAVCAIPCPAASARVRCGPSLSVESPPQQPRRRPSAAEIRPAACYYQERASAAPNDQRWRSTQHLWPGECCLVSYRQVQPPTPEQLLGLRARRDPNDTRFVCVRRCEGGSGGQTGQTRPSGFVRKSGRREWDRTTDHHHVKVMLYR
jgi:hypothetical protein